MAAVNRTTVQTALRDVDEEIITDAVTVKFYNQRLASLNQVFPFRLEGKPKPLSNVPAFPYGIAEVFIKPASYRFKSIFVNVPSGKPYRIEETCFVDPDHVKPEFPHFDVLVQAAKWKQVWRVLQDSEIDITRWNGLTAEQKAGFFNLVAKLQSVQVGDKPALALVDEITDIRPARFFARVKRSLLNIVRKDRVQFRPVPGSLHEFPRPWRPIQTDGSFKTADSAGNLQLTFADNAAGELLADIDIDDHQGIAHAADVLRHKITGKDTHPYDIHQILKFFQRLDPGYSLVPREVFA